MSLVNTNWLEENLNKVKIIDCSWDLPSANKNFEKEFKNEHIPNAIFFDLDKNSKKDTDLPHMLPSKDDWDQIVSKLGISKKDRIVIYDNSNVISSCRCWYTFIYFGHSPKLVSILDGGFRKWKKEKKITSSKITKFSETNYSSTELNILVKDKNEIDSNIVAKNFVVVDARSKERFEGTATDPRKNVRSGSIPNSVCLPFSQVVNEDYCFKSRDHLKKIFEKTLPKRSDLPVFSCGSGVTACVLALAYSLVNANYLPVIYDGSWAEYGKI